MKLLILSLFIVMSLAKPVWVQEWEVQPEGKYTNQSGGKVYLVLELAPGASFDNKTEYDFRILRRHDLLRLNVDSHIDVRIDSLIISLEQKEKVLSENMKSLEELEEKRKENNDE